MTFAARTTAIAATALTLTVAHAQQPHPCLLYTSRCV